MPVIMIAALDVRDRHVKIEVVSVTATYYRCYLSTNHLDEKSIIISINEMPKISVLSRVARSKRSR